jgi:two-component system sensor histidine kinase PilS (NtrC family)
MNETACDLLNYHKSAPKVPLEEISPILSQRLATWLSTGMHNPKPFRQDEHLPDISPNFSHLIGGKGGSDTLVFLEDSAQVAQQLQHIKLAALGRLTAGIAHEIRNPLASISHAAQLLSESPTTSGGDRRLKQIIHENAKRASRIITNVMELSRRDRAKPEDIVLKPWLEEFCREFMRGFSSPRPEIEIRIDPGDLGVRFDTSHLHQIVWNLCTNACTHGTPPGRTPRIRLAAEMDEKRSRPYLDIIDFGPGIPKAEARKMFEPFFTTQPRGTGLGLYISREICEANRSQLQYVRQSDGGSCFRITFANPSKQDVTAKWNFAKP